MNVESLITASRPFLDWVVNWHNDLDVLSLDSVIAEPERTVVLAVDVVKKLGISCGVIINRDGIGDGKVEEYCLKETIPILMRIPLDIKIARLYSRGITLAEGIPRWREDFLELFNKIEQLVGGKNSREGGW